MLALFSQQILDGWRLNAKSQSTFCVVLSCELEFIRALAIKNFAFEKPSHCSDFKFSNTISSFFASKPELTATSELEVLFSQRRAMFFCRLEPYVAKNVKREKNIDICWHPWSVPSISNGLISSINGSIDSFLLLGKYLTYNHVVLFIASNYRKADELKHVLSNNFFLHSYSFSSFGFLLLKTHWIAVCL